MSNHNLLHIKQIVNPENFQKIQDDISLATGLAIITVDYKGIPITAHSYCSEFCRIMRASDLYKHNCEKCDSIGGLEAARIQKPFIYFCHAGVVDLAIPIIVDDLYLGAFMAGQLLLDKEDEADKLEHIFFSAGSINTIDFSGNKILEGYYSLLPVMSIERIKSFANVLQHIINFYVENAILKSSITQSSPNESFFELNGASKNDSDDANEKTPKWEISKKETDMILQPAIAYISQHSFEKISLAHMAALCNISPSYFSRLFSRKKAGSLSNYVNEAKVSKAKELLQKTDWPVRYIADKLGFDDSSYFIKVFKKETDLTPGEFRKVMAEGPTI
jgi:ligand-binding sensor protein/AraC-like DNA-binding protein